ncbi:MAG: hypothetical protein AAF419_04275 [Pseudomonadota bacterium]
MSKSVEDVTLITTANMNEYFHDAIQTAVARQHLSRNDETIIYIVNMLSHFALSTNVYDEESEGRSTKPLAFIYKDALESQTEEERIQHLRKLGDISLFISGFYAESLSRGLVSIDYFASMGGNAYSTIADNAQRTVCYKTMSEVFFDLSEHFLNYVDVLMEVRDNTSLAHDSDILCLYENWLNTGSDYAREKLKEQGILTFPANTVKH